MALEKLIQYYMGRITRGVQQTMHGYHFFIRTEVLISEEHKQMGFKLSSYSSPEVINARSELLLGELYDRLKEFDKDDLEHINETVDDPLLNGAYKWLNSKGGLEKTSRKKFSKNFNAKSVVRHRTISNYFRPIILLDVLKQKPSLIEKLDESSAYFPHRLFREKKPRTTKKDIEKEIAEVILDMYSPELCEFMEKLPLIHRPPLYASRKDIEWSGIYENHDLKKDVYETVVDALNLVKNIVIKARKNIKKFKSAFSTTTLQYRRIIYSAKDFARNQILGSFKRHKGEKVYESYLAEKCGMSAKVHNKKLIIKEGKKTSILTLENEFISSTRGLPCAVYMLKKFYDNAKGLEDNLKK